MDSSPSTSHNRYNFSTDSDITNIVKDSVPDSTKAKSRWAKSLFEDYNKRRNENILNKNLEDLMVLKPLKEMSKGDLEFILPKFINDARKKDGTKFPPNSLRQLVCALFHHLRYEEERDWDFFKDKEFCLARKALDSCMKIGTKEGLGLKTKKAEFISWELEEKLWDEGHLGSATPRQLLRTLVYMIGIHFGLRARKEHRQLRWGPASQFLLFEDSVTKVTVLRYTEDCQKTRSGGLMERNIQPKVIDRYEEDNDKNIVKIFKKYLSKRPKVGKNLEEFYLQPRNDYKPDVWFKDQAVGENTIGEVIKKIFIDAGVSGYFTNHSLRRSKASRLFQSGMDKEIVKTETGHRSDDGVMVYREFSQSEKRTFQRAIEYGPMFSGEKSEREIDISDQASNLEKIHIEIKRGEKFVRIDL